MATMTITVTAAGVSVGDMNAKLTDSTKPHDGVEQLRNLMDACMARGIPATITVAVTTGDSVTYNLS